MMSRKLAIGVLLIAIVFNAVGLVFLCAGTRQPGRYIPAAAFLILGVGLAVSSGISLRRSRALDPENLSDRITELARKGGQYEVTLSEVVAELRVPDEAAQTALDLLVSKRQCRREPREGRAVYIFPGLKESKVVRRCVYCGSEFSVKEPLHACPNCGGEVQLVRE